MAHQAIHDQAPACTFVVLLANIQASLTWCLLIWALQSSVAYLKSNYKCIFLDWCSRFYFVILWYGFSFFFYFMLLVSWDNLATSGLHSKWKLMLRLTHEDNEVIEQPPSLLCPTQMMQHTPGEHSYLRLCTSDLVNVARSVHTIPRVSKILIEKPGLSLNWWVLLRIKKKKIGWTFFFIATVAMQQQLSGECLPCRLLPLMHLRSLTVFRCLVKNSHLPSFFCCFHPV